MKEADALYLFGKNKPVNELNKKRILKLDGKELTINAKCFQDCIKDFKPPINKNGDISNTPFQAQLVVKVGAKIMLTYNIDTADGLTNGSRGELMGVLRNKSEEITKLVKV